MFFIMGFDMKHKLDKNNPIVKWIDFLFTKYDLTDLVVEHIICNGVKPKSEKEANLRVMNFFKALTEKYKYSPEQAFKDINKYKH
jgi:hypothetical protein